MTDRLADNRSLESRGEVGESTPTRQGLTAGETAPQRLAVLDRIRDEAIAIQDTNRYGHFSNPVMLGLLLAAEIVRAESDTSAIARPDDATERAVWPESDTPA